MIEKVKHYTFFKSKMKKWTINKKYIHKKEKEKQLFLEKFLIMYSLFIFTFSFCI